MHCFLESNILKSCLCVQPGDVGSGFPLAQDVYWESKASFHELAFGPCRDFPDKSLSMLHFLKHTRKSFKDVSSLLLALSCLFRAKERRWSFNNLEQFWYPMSLPYHFRTLYRPGWFYIFYDFPEILQERVGLVWISMENTEAFLDFVTKFFEPGKTKSETKNICNDCSGILMYRFHTWGRMSLIANTKLVGVLCKLSLINTKDIGGKVLGSILFRILGQSLF